MIETDLSQLKIGETGIVKSIGLAVSTAKLVEMGLFKGRKVKVVFKAPFGGPIAVSLDGYVLALRIDEACIVSLENISRES